MKKHLEKKTQKTYLFRKFTVEEGVNASYWCNKNRIKVCPLPKKDGIYLEVYRKDKVFVIPETFTNKNLSDMIYRVYIKLFEQYSTDKYPMWKTKIIKNL